MGAIADIDKFHQSKKGKLAFAVLETVLAYIVISRAIDTGSLWQWAAGLLLFVGAINNLVRLIRQGVRPGAKGKAKTR